MEDEALDRVMEMQFDAATAYRIVLGELLVELGRNQVLRPMQIAKVLLRAENVIALLDRPELHRMANDMLSTDVQRRLALQPHVFALRARAKRIGRRYRRPPRPANRP